MSTINDDCFELLSEGYDESEICWDCGHVTGDYSKYNSCKGNECDCETCAEECGELHNG